MDLFLAGIFVDISFLFHYENNQILSEKINSVGYIFVGKKQ